MQQAAEPPVEEPTPSAAETEKGTRGGTAATDPDEPRRCQAADGAPVVAATPGTGAAEGAGSCRERRREGGCRVAEDATGRKS